NIDFMYSLPLSCQIDQTRQSNNIIQQILSDKYIDCINFCDQNVLCALWNWQLVNNQTTCLLYSDVPYNVYIRDNIVWEKTPANGQYSLWPFLSSNQIMTATVDNDINHLLNGFVTNGGWYEQTQIKQSDLPIDNYYSLIFNNVTHVGQSIDIGENTNQLEIIIKDILTLHNIYINSSLPDYLIDSLINSVSHMRSAMYFANGDWRQREAYDCNDVDSVHNDHQHDGMIQESFTVGCMGDTQPYDTHGGRRMGDVTTIFLLETLELYKWTNDSIFLNDMYPRVLDVCTYDIPGLDQYPTTTFNSFMHLAAMGACMQL
ncbi:unnamed protein product, partial [Didymodactylos carnosus]